MVNIENLFNNAFSAIKTHPKIILPLVLNWIPQTIITVAITLIASDIIKGHTLIQLYTSFEANPLDFITTLLYSYPYHLSFIAIAIILTTFISTFAKSFYPTLSYQIYYRQKIQLSQATEVAEKRFLKVLWTDILFSIISNIMIFSLIIISIIFIALSITLGGITGLITGSITAIATLVTLFIAVAYIYPIWVILEPIVIIEKLSGIRAIERSHTILKGKLGEVWKFVLLLAIANGLYHVTIGLMIGIFNFALGEQSIVLNMILLLFSSAFMLLSYSLLYLEISPESISLSDAPPKTY